MSDDASDTATPRRAILPTWLGVVLAVGCLGSFVVSLVERAVGSSILMGTIFVAVLVPLIRYYRYGRGTRMSRSLPLLTFLGLLFFALATIRIDGLSGNLFPTRLSFRWQPQRDELLVIPQHVQPSDEVDLSLTGEHDFPQFLGPHRNGFVPIKLAADWETDPPKLIWKNEQFGAGWSGFAAVNGYAVTLEQRGEYELVTCYQVDTGELVWTHGEQTRHQTVLGGVGPRSTPTIYNGRVYTLGATGILLCLNGFDGSLVWRKNLLEEIGTTPAEDLKRIAYGRSTSPLIDRGRVIVPLGMPNGASLIALDAVDGTELWRKGDQQISYASPMIATLDGVRQFVQVCESQVCGHDAQSGDVLWEHPWEGSSDSRASCSQPIDVGADRLFLSKGYAHGSALLEVKHADEQWSATKLWHHRTVMKTKFTNAVLHLGHIYGLDDGILSCVHLETGRRVWKRGRYGHGQILRVEDCLLVQAETGEVALVALDPSGFAELARFQAIEGKTWNNPCLFGKYLLVRNSAQAACYLLP